MTGGAGLIGPAPAGASGRGAISTATARAIFSGNTPTAAVLSGMNKAQSGQWWRPAWPGTGWNADQIGDFNGDGKSDIVWQHTDGSTAICSWTGWASAAALFSWVPAPAGVSSKSPTSMVTVRATSSGSTPMAARHHGRGGWISAALLRTDPAGCQTIADFNGDGKSIVAAAPTTALPSGSWTGWASAAAPSFSVPASAGACNRWVISTAMARATSSGSTRMAALSGSWTGWASAAAYRSRFRHGMEYQPYGRFNGDSKSDLLLQHTDDRTTLWLMNGLGIDSVGNLLGSATGWSPFHNRSIR